MNRHFAVTMVITVLLRHTCHTFNHSCDGLSAKKHLAQTMTDMPTHSTSANTSKAVHWPYDLQPQGDTSLTAAAKCVGDSFVNAAAMSGVQDHTMLA
jgi:hypothetical protein